MTQKRKQQQRVNGNACLIENIEECIVDPLLGVDGGAVVVLVRAAVVHQEEVLQCHPVVLFVGDHQLVVQAKHNELEEAHGG